MSEIIDTKPRNTTLSENSDGEYDPQFKPIVTLPEVEIVTNEENESVLLKMRAKLYRFDTSSEPSEWKERGTGEMKILQHNESNAVRIVMRRDKTFKVCANHLITPWMVLRPCSGNDRAFIYTASDFADEVPKSECLAIKFANIDNANIFKTKFEEAKEVVSTKCALYNGECENEEEESTITNSEEKQVTEQFAQLDVNTKDSEENIEK